MSNIKLSRRKFPWTNDAFTSLLDADDFFVDDFFIKKGSIPPMNIKETKDTYEIEFAIPGFVKNEIIVEMEDDLLMVSARKSDKLEEKDEEFIRKEFIHREFERKFKVPNHVDCSEKVTAHYSHGILSLKLLKKEEAKIKSKEIIEVA